MLRAILIKLVKWLHTVVFVFNLMGWALPWSWAWMLHLVLIPSVVLQWKYNDGTCYLTNLEHWLAQTKIEKTAQQGGFIKAMLSRCFDPLPSDTKIKFYLYLVIWSAWLVSGLRTYLAYSI